MDIGMKVVKIILVILGIMIFGGGFYSLTQFQKDEVNQKIDKLTMAVGFIIEVIAIIWLL